MERNIIIIGIIFLFVAIVSCSKDNEVNLEAPRNYLSEIYQDSTKIAQIFYDKRKRVGELIQYDSLGGILLGQLNTFDSKSRNTVVKYYDSTKVGLLGIVELTYGADGLLYQATHQDKNYEKTHRISYEYYETKRVKKEYYYVKRDSTFHLERYFLYSYDTQGNVTIKKEYEKPPIEITPALKKIWEFEYDSHSNPYKNVTFIEGFNSYSVNNVTAVKVTNQLGEILSETYSSEFTYNEDGYPVMEARLYLRDFFPTYFEYTYLKELGNGDLPNPEATQNTNNDFDK